MPVPFEQVISLQVSGEKGICTVQKYTSRIHEYTKTQNTQIHIKMVIKKKTLEDWGNRLRDKVLAPYAQMGSTVQNPP